MYILGIELKGNDAFLALIDKHGRCCHQQKVSLGDRSDATQVATFQRSIKHFIKPHTITRTKLTRSHCIMNNANAIDLIRMETVFQLLFSCQFSVIGRRDLENWLTHHVVAHQPVNSFHRAVGAAHFEQQR